MMIGLGSSTVVDDPAKCPTGAWPSVIAAPTGSSKVYYECKMGEPWYCRWFGWGCKGIPVAPPAAPQTKEQMRNPLAWTPELSAEKTYQKQQEVTSAWLEATGGIATIPSAAYEVGKEIGEAVSTPRLWFVAGAAAVVAVILLAKRV